ncbi:hypothetical protein HID58_075087 [Brassica napus]|uniref:Uncharacterized protein n=1 Tax=Brassica napus TaxID=3708 RepID=A0ABQ7YLU1_BRANA|nr:hypothetical protein HID58_075087 [Brassica napus]
MEQASNLSSADGTVVGAQVMERRQREASVVERQGREAHDSGNGTVVGAQLMERRQREASVVARQGREAPMIH